MLSQMTILDIESITIRVSRSSLIHFTVSRSSLIHFTVSSIYHEKENQRKGEKIRVKADVNEKYDKKIKITSVNLLESLILYRSKWSISLKEVLLTIKSVSG